ncbi:hypothetical protein PVK06_042959 [Gossypium arboreum]|uniref:Uncharacterized protein n=1 Tax=Gossypium arboreum TaxID=29729 RepID=A0ABR0MM73_GOSAR|nr:hypothetical protein PVK06_042959 [Gossypium arboreum]
MYNAITGFTDRLKTWNNCVYGHISQRKRLLMHKLSKVQHAVDFSGSNSLRRKEDTLKSEAVNFYQKLYGEDLGSVGNLPHSDFRGLNSKYVAFLGHNVSSEEIKVVFFNMAPFKAPGSDGFQAGFFQKQWDIIGEDICVWVKNVFDGGIIVPEFNNTLIVLIPKVQNPENFSQFRSISLCSVLYKLVTKIIANRYFRMVSQPRSLSQFHGSILAREWNPIRISRSGPSLSHLFFADDLVIFSRADVVHSDLLAKYLSNFCDISGHKVNARKTNVFFSAGVNISSRNEIKEILGFHEVNNLGHYLGVPLFPRRVTKSILDFLVEKVQNRLPSWDAKSLSFAGRVTLTQFVLMTIPSYFMQSSLVPKGVCDAIEGLGLGFRHLSDQNSAFMMKLGYNLISKTRTLWVQVLRGKYGMKNSMPDSIMMSSCSYMWRAIVRAWPLLRSFIIWSIGNGETVRCWEDCWVLDKGSLKNYVSGYGSFDPKTTVSEMVLPNGEWDLVLFRLWLPEVVVERIISIPPSMVQVGPDSFSWSRTTSGVFSVKSAYYVLNEDYWHPQETKWKRIWKIPRPHRVKHFLWLVLKQRLLTNSERVQKGIEQDASCQICGYSMKDASHILRYCSFVKEIWHQIIPTFQLRSFFSASMSDWLTSNLQLHSFNRQSDDSWPCLFGIILWRIWKNWNLTIFQGTGLNPKDIINASYSWAKHFLYSFNDGMNLQLQQLSVRQTPGKYVFLNTDGAIHSVSGLSAAGGMLSNSKGEWILGFTRFLGKCSVATAKLWGLLDGLLIAQKQGYNEVIIRSDNLENVILINESKADRSNNALIKWIQHILALEENWVLNYVPRKTNRVADALAKFSLSSGSSLRIFESPPSKIIDIL